GVIVEEMNMYYDTPRDFIGGVYEELLYGDQPLGWDIIGRKETIRAAGRDTFLGYTGRWYKPERMVVGLGGNVGGDAVAKIEQGVIVEEMNMYYDTPRDFIGGVYEELLYGDQPLGWDIIGRKETVRAAERDTFLGYTDRWYKPERMVVGLGGNVGGDAVSKIEQLLGDLPATETGEPAAAEVQANGPRVKIHHKQSDQAHLCVGVPSYPLAHPDRYVLQLLATVLGTGMSSRLFTEVRERRGLAYYVFGINHSYTDAGSLYSQAGVDINRAD